MVRGFAVIGILFLSTFALCGIWCLMVGVAKVIDTLPAIWRFCVRFVRWRVRVHRTPRPGGMHYE